MRRRQPGLRDAQAPGGGRRTGVVDRTFRGVFPTLDSSTFQRQDGLLTLVPIGEMEVKSAVARPALGEVVPAGKDYRVYGAAWTGESEIAKVEVSTDGGKT